MLLHISTDNIYFNIFYDILDCMSYRQVNIKSLEVAILQANTLNAVIDPAAAMYIGRVQVVRLLIRKTTAWNRQSLFTGLDWNTGLEYWTGLSSFFGQICVYF